MTTVINNPVPVADAKGSGFLVGSIVLIGLVLILLYFLIPALRNMGPIELKVPAPQIVMPDKINVNVQQAK